MPGSSFSYLRPHLDIIVITWRDCKLDAPALLVPASQLDDCERKLSFLVSIGNVLVCRKTFRDLLPFNSGSDTSAKRNMVLLWGLARLANFLEC
jgi:hypothetical protein